MQVFRRSSKAWSASTCTKTHFFACTTHSSIVLFHLTVRVLSLPFNHASSSPLRHGWLHRRPRPSIPNGSWLHYHSPLQRRHPLTPLRLQRQRQLHHRENLPRRLALRRKQVRASLPSRNTVQHRPPRQPRHLPLLQLLPELEERGARLPGLRAVYGGVERGVC